MITRIQQHNLTSPISQSFSWIKRFVTSFRQTEKIIRQFHEVAIDPWPGDSTVARAYIQGRFEFANRILTLNEFIKTLSMAETLEPKLLVQTHSFEWLRDFRCISDSASRRLSRQLIHNWIEANGISLKKKWSNPAFEPHIMGYRLYNWISLFDFYAASADDRFHETLVLSIYHQMNHLHHHMKKIHDPIQKFIALKGLLFAQVAFKTDSTKLNKTISLLQSTIERQITADGSHFTRDPQIQLYILRDMIDIRTLLKSANLESSFLNETIIKMTPIVRLFRHGDGGLADFCTSRLIHQFPIRRKPSQALIDMILTLSDVKGKAPGRAIDMGYERLNVKNALILVNTKPIIDIEDKFFGPGIGALNFEWSNGRTRYIQKSDVVIQNAHNRWVTLPVAKDAVVTQNVERKIHNGHILLESRVESVTAQLDSQGQQIAINYGRDIYLSNDGSDVRGFEKIYLTSEAVAALRFVFAEGIELTTTNGVNSLGAIIKIPLHEQRKSSSSRSSKIRERFQLCRFICHGADEINVQYDEITNTNAMLLVTKLQSEHTCDIKWAFHLQNEL